MVLKLTGKSLLVGFDHFADLGDINVIVYNKVGNIIRCFCYCSDGFWLEALDVVNIGYYCRFPQLNSICADWFEEKFIVE